MKRKLAAIMAGDVVGYSRMMSEDETATYRELRETFDGIVEPAVDTHGGRIFKQNGDGFLASFASVHEALDAAAEIQDALLSRRFRLRIGLNLGDVIEDGEDVYGDGVNVAMRLEASAEPGTIYVSESVVRSVEKASSRVFRRVGRRAAKNMPSGIETYVVATGEPSRIALWARIAPLSFTRGVLVAGVAAAALVVTVGAIEGGFGTTGRWFGYHPFAQPTFTDARPSVAVMPFDNLSGDPAQGYFSDGLTEDLITDLSRNPDIAVVARNSTFALRDESQDVRRVGTKLGARYVVDGSTQRSGDQLRVSAQLIDAETGTHLWARTFDRRADDVFAIQAELTGAIAASLVSYVRQSELASANRRPTENLRAYDLVLRAKEMGAHKTGGAEAFLRSRTMLQQALALDPSYAAAHAWLGLNLISDRVSAVTGRATDADLEAGIGQAREAIRLQPDLALAYRVLGFGLSARSDYSEALQAMERAVDLNPNDPDNLAALAKAQLRTGAYADAANNAARARRLHPMAPNYYAFLEAQAFYAADRFDEAEVAIQDCALGGDQRANCLRISAAIDARLGRIETAHRAMTDLALVDPAFSIEGEKQLQRFGATSMTERYIADLSKAAGSVSGTVDTVSRNARRAQM